LLSAAPMPQGSAVLEQKFGAGVAAHVGLGHAATDRLSLVTSDRRFLNIYDDTCPDAISIEPLETQSVSAHGDTFAAVTDRTTRCCRMRPGTIRFWI
jgi:hypothetical protein